MSCCKSKSPSPELVRRNPSKPKYKYSFKHRSRVLVDNLSTSAASRTDSVHKLKISEKEEKILYQ